ncbi:SDR family NAD(P)-dependent oxidoreductase [Chloroflexota bacterium]
MRIDKRFRDKIAIVTGGSEGIGKSIALGLAREGAKVAIFARRLDVLKQAVEDIKGLGGEAMGLGIDVAISQQVNDGVHQVLERFSKVDILVNNAGGNTHMPFYQTTEDLWDHLIALNLKSQFACCRAVLDNMIERNYGKIVAISSDAGRAGTGRGGAIYSACKGGIIAFTKSLAIELARYKINVNSIAPGFVETEALRERFAADPAKLEQGVSGIPMHRAGQPDEVTAAVLFLASDNASYITGQTLSVNGGVIMID